MRFVRLYFRKYICKKPKLARTRRVVAAEVAAIVHRLINTVIQHVAGVNVQLWLWYKALIHYSILLPGTQSAVTDGLRADCCVFSFQVWKCFC